MVVGYASGVFDLFHVGHLNILRRARLSCDYLIAGVTTDSEVQRVKGALPFMSETDRLLIVSQIKYVDRAYLDRHAHDKSIAWDDLHFQVIFKGSDWVGTQKGVALERDFARLGVRVVFLPYTRLTSSTALRLGLLDAR